jgi:hypothetical protein
MVSNDRYELGRAEGFGSRRRIDAGTLGIVAARFQSSDDAAKFAQLHASGRTRRPEGWLEWCDTAIEVRSGQAVEIGINGEAMLLDPPIRFWIVPGALRVRIPRHAPGYSPAAAVPAKGLGHRAAADRRRSTGHHRAVSRQHHPRYRGLPCSVGTPCTAGRLCWSGTGRDTHQRSDALGTDEPDAALDVVSLRLIA